MVADAGGVVGEAWTFDGQTNGIADAGGVGGEASRHLLFVSWRYWMLNYLSPRSATLPLARLLALCSLFFFDASTTQACALYGGSGVDCLQSFHLLLFDFDRHSLLLSSI
jgi:hypothetical protein